LWQTRRQLSAIGERVFRIPCGLPDLGDRLTVCFISSATRRAAEELGGWIFRHSTVSYCGINTDDFPIGAAPPRTDWGWRLLHVGRIDDRKGIDSAIRALALLPPEATLEVVGRGDERYRHELGALAEALGVADRIRFSLAERGELADIYAAADVLLFPPRWAEPFGLVPLEAMASSTPVVATGTGGSGEFLLDRANCLRVPVDDHAAIASAVRRLAGDAGLRNQLVVGGHATATELSLPRWVDILQRWHAAAADRFCDGQPLDREQIERTLARIGIAETK
jgi:glycosyltransferase involved in cell wall biosynthesis